MNTNSKQLKSYDFFVEWRLMNVQLMIDYRRAFYSYARYIYTSFRLQMLVCMMIRVTNPSQKHSACSLIIYILYNVIYNL
jgi:hypothetical protein